MLIRFINSSDIHKPDHLGNTPLMCGVLAGSLAVVELLIQMGAEAKREDNMGNTTLHSAIQTGNEDIVKVCLRSFRSYESHLHFIHLSQELQTFFTWEQDGEKRYSCFV